MSDRPVHGPLGELFWRDEITELLFWRELSGLGTTATAEDIQQLAPPGAGFEAGQLDRLVDQELLAHGPHGYELTEAGRAQGARLFVADPDLPPLHPRTIETIAANPRVEVRALLELRAAIEDRMRELAARRGR